MRRQTVQQKHVRATGECVYSSWCMRGCGKCGGRWQGLRAPGKVRVCAGRTLKVASAIMAESALPLADKNVKNFTTALKRMHTAVGKAVCVMCQCLNSQMDQFVESDGISPAAGSDETRRARPQPAA